MNKILLVDQDDNVLGYEDKMKCHLGDGILHRAFSVFVFKTSFFYKVDKLV